MAKMMQRSNASPGSTSLQEQRSRSEGTHQFLNQAAELDRVYDEDSDVSIKHFHPCLILKTGN